MTTTLINLLSKTIESRKDTATVIVHLYVITGAVSTPKSDDARTVQQTGINNVGQHSLGIVKQLLCLFA